MISENLIMYPKNDGISIPSCSAIDFTMKLGPLPIYVIDPKNTAPIEIAFKNGSVASFKPSGDAISLNTIAVGALSRNDDNKPVAYTYCHGALMNSAITSFCSDRYISAGVIVAKIPRNTHATSKIGVQL